MNDRKFSLRLVHGGAAGKTEPTPEPAAVTTAPPPSSSIPKPQQGDELFIVPATLLSQAEADSARKLILGYVLDGKSVRERLALAELAVTPGESGLSSPVSTYMEIFRKLDQMGIALSTGGPAFGLATMTYATVLENKKLVRYIPELKNLSKKLPGLALY
ncbi:hypothetical protein [Caballeronia ptereochthonis]|uniref:Uncharacterized protein n=1 Tax=Caballeronia ptereochthonis TaxID=1777144 RepID=A0A158CVT5_9BURK|nr:hypothetical protein [Caballeronia ptereochthonis]SAK86036.1 hypothetical protein AWB83_04699 [Caballeronia ptereochthonis]